MYLLVINWKATNLQQGWLPINNEFFLAALRCSLLEFNALIAIPVHRACKQGIKFKAGALKCCKEIQITAPPNEWGNIPLYLEQNNFGLGGADGPLHPPGYATGQAKHRIH